MATVKPDPSNGGTVGVASGSPAALAVPAPPDRGRPGRGDGEEGSMTSAITATGLRKSFGGTRGRLGSEEPDQPGPARFSDQRNLLQPRSAGLTAMGEPLAAWPA